MEARPSLADRAMAVKKEDVEKISRENQYGCDAKL
jgi:hypothetical protein